MLVKLIKYILVLISILLLSIFIWEYKNTVHKDSLVIEQKEITIFTQAKEGRFGVFIFPKQQYILFFLNLCDYIEMIESDTKKIAVLGDDLRIYIPENKVFISHNRKKYLLKENTIQHLKNFSGFSNVYIYHGDNKIEKEFEEDTSKYIVIEHS